MFRDLWAIAKLYWLGDEKKNALTLVIVLAILLLLNIKLSATMVEVSGNFLTALSKKDSAGFWQEIFILLGLKIIMAPVNSVFYFTQNKLTLYWRRWLTYNFVTKYFRQRAFYLLNNFQKDIDNPDQRITQDIDNFTLVSLNYTIHIIRTIIQFFTFSVILWRISKLLVILLLIYTLIGLILAPAFFGKVLVKLNLQQLTKEADFRFGLIRVRENAESIAFYQGEAQELSRLKNLFKEVFKNKNRLILWKDIYLGLFNKTYEYVPFILPAVILAPKILAGELEIGKLSEATGAFNVIFFSMNVFISQFADLTAFGAGIKRLQTFDNFLESTSIVQKEQIKYIESSDLVIKNLSLKTPDGVRTIFDNLSLRVSPGQGLLVMGVSGCGKSSLLRAIAGLWYTGMGEISRPNLKEILFLPQRPYMTIGSLREQLIYPQIECNIDNTKLYQVLKKVNLENLVERFGGLDIEKDWSNVLSLGEQQRLAFARLLVNSPNYAILDEATSALDLSNEHNLYHHLQQTQTTFISVGHRPSLINYHDHILQLGIEDHSWQIKKGDRHIF